MHKLKKAKSAAVTMNETQKEKQQFAYGFYKTYMNSLIYSQLSDLSTVIAKKFVSPKVLKKTADTGADVLLDAQDCIEENVRTLQVVPINNDWFCVTFMWTSTYDKIPSQKKVIYDQDKGAGQVIYHRGCYYCEAKADKKYNSEFIIHNS